MRGQYYYELVAAQSSHKVILAALLLQRLSDGPQSAVTLHMTVEIVELLEAIRSHTSTVTLSRLRRARANSPSRCRNNDRGFGRPVSTSVVADRSACVYLSEFSIAAEAREATPERMRKSSALKRSLVRRIQRNHADQFRDAFDRYR